MSSIFSTLEIRVAAVKRCCIFAEHESPLMYCQEKKLWKMPSYWVQDTQTIQQLWATLSWTSHECKKMGNQKKSLIGSCGEKKWFGQNLMLAGDIFQDQGLESVLCRNVLPTWAVLINEGSFWERLSTSRQSDFDSKDSYLIRLVLTDIDER